MALNSVGESSSPLSGTSDYGQTLGSGAILALNAPEAIKQAWSKDVFLGEQNGDFWMQHIGSNPNSPIWYKRDLQAGDGHKVTFKAHRPFSKMPKRGGAHFLNPEDFDRPSLVSYNLEVDWTRFAYSDDDRAEGLMGMKNELRTGVSRMQGEQWGKQKTHDMDATLLLKVPAANVQFAAGRAGFDDLLISDTLSKNDVISGKHALGRIAKPCMINRKTDDGVVNEIKKYLFVSPSDNLYGLETELLNSGIITEGDIRGASNFAQSGGWINLRGQCIQERAVVDEASPGPWGSFLNPKGSLGKDMADGVTGDGGPSATNATELWGGHNPEWAVEENHAPLRHFSGYSYEFMAGDTFSPGGATANTPGAAPKYVIAYNVGGTDTGKWGFYRYASVASDARYLTCDQYLRSSAGGQQSRGLTQVGNVVWDADKNTTTHTAGLTVLIPATQNGVPYGYTIGLGAGGAMMAYGAFRNRRGTDRFDDIVTKKYLASIYGQALRYDAAARAHGVRIIVSAINYADLNINPTLA